MQLRVFTSADISETIYIYEYEWHVNLQDSVVVLCSAVEFDVCSLWSNQKAAKLPNGKQLLLLLIRDAFSIF